MKTKRRIVFSGLIAVVLGAAILSRHGNDEAALPMVQEPQLSSRTLLPKRAHATVSSNSQSGIQETSKGESLFADRWRFERDPEEWQGQRQDPSEHFPCIEGMCAKARACIDAVCLPCVEDSECLEGESCVMGSCLLEQQVECSSWASCGEGEMCVISELTPGEHRGNSEMTASCLATVGGEAQPDVVEEWAEPERELDSPSESISDSPQYRAAELLRAALDSDSEFETE